MSLTSPRRMKNTRWAAKGEDKTTVFETDSVACSIMFAPRCSVLFPSTYKNGKWCSSPVPPRFFNHKSTYAALARIRRAVPDSRRKTSYVDVKLRFKASLRQALAGGQGMPTASALFVATCVSRDMDGRETNLKKNNMAVPPLLARMYFVQILCESHEGPTVLAQM